MYMYTEYMYMYTYNYNVYTCTCIYHVYTCTRKTCNYHVYNYTCTSNNIMYMLRFGVGVFGGFITPAFTLACLYRRMRCLIRISTSRITSCNYNVMFIYMYMYTCELSCL